MTVVKPKAKDVLPKSCLATFMGVVQWLALIHMYVTYFLNIIFLFNTSEDYLNPSEGQRKSCEHSENEHLLHRLFIPNFTQTL